jgi:hypothetical protein
MFLIDLFQQISHQVNRRFKLTENQFKRYKTWKQDIQECSLSNPIFQNNSVSTFLSCYHMRNKISYSLSEKHKLE